MQVDLLCFVFVVEEVLELYWFGKGQGYVGFYVNGDFQGVFVGFKVIGCGFGYVCQWGVVGLVQVIVEVQLLFFDCYWVQIQGVGIGEELNGV